MENGDEKIRTVMRACMNGSKREGGTWTLREYERDRLETFEMWTWLYMENISWNDQITNEYMLGIREKKAFK